MSDLAAVLDQLVDAGVARAYLLGKVPERPAYPYAVVSVAPAAPVVRTLAGPGKPSGRFVVQHFGSTPESVDALAAMTFAAFDGVALPDVPGTPVAWQEVASAVYLDPDDDGVLTVTHTYRY